MNAYALKYTDKEDISDVIELAERSFGADLSPVYDKPVRTLGEFIDLMNQYTPGESATDCTTQQAFYRIRSSLAITVGIDPNTIRPDTALDELIPLANRRSVVANLLKELGVTSRLLVPIGWQPYVLVTLFFCSIFTLKFSWLLGLTGLVTSFTGMWLSERTAATFSVTTVGQLSQKRSREHYRTMRRSATTVNRGELESLLFDLFSHELSVPRHRLTRSTLLWRN